MLMASVGIYASIRAKCSFSALANGKRNKLVLKSYQYRGKLIEFSQPIGSKRAEQRDETEN
jgi:hypothetical protein